MFVVLNPEEVRVHAMPGGVLFIVVDGPSDVAGAGYTLEATCAGDLLPRPGQACGDHLNGCHSTAVTFDTRGTVCEDRVPK